MASLAATSSERVSGDTTSETKNATTARRRDRQINPPPIRISERDEARLMSYLGELGTAFERSVAGVILERQQQFGANSARCRRCRGAGIIDGPGGFGVFTEEVQATRRAPTRSGIEGVPDESTRWEQRERQVSMGGWCRPCNGTGSVPKSKEELPLCAVCDGKGRVAAFNYRPGVHSAPCRPCLGTGQTKVTVEPTGSSVEGSGNLPNEDKLYEFAEMSRHLGAVRSRDRRAARAIELMFGDQGARWARTSHGRLFALLQETHAGKKLAKWGDDRAADAAHVERAAAAGKKRPKKREPTRWVNPAPAFNARAFAEPAPARPAIEKLWERAASRPKPRCKACRGRGGFVAFNHQPGVHRARCTACDGSGEAPKRVERGWLPGAAVGASEHKAPRPPVDLTIQDRIAAEADEEHKKPNDYRRKLLLEATEQARQLFMRASKLWVMVGASLGRKLTKRQADERSAVVRLHERLKSRGQEGAADYVAEQVRAR